MQGAVQSRRSRVKAMVALMLTFGSGIVDIVGYIAVYHWFVAHMTGNTVHLGNQLVTGRWDDAAKAATVIFAFILGSVFGRAIVEAGARKRQRNIASITLLAEAVLILAFIWLKAVVFPSQEIPLPMLLVLLALLAAAMGLQTATLTKIGPLTIHTTFVTGMLNKFAEAISEWFFWVYDHFRSRQSWRGLTQHRAFRNAGLMALIWFSYMLGSVLGTWMYPRWNAWILSLPVVLLIIALAIDQWQPLAIEEEKEQIQR